MPCRLRALQDRDDEKVANEKAKNNLESYIFETQSWLEVTEVVAMSTEEQRETIRVAVREVYGWFEEEGYYNAETKVRVVYNFFLYFPKPLSTRFNER